MDIADCRLPITDLPSSQLRSLQRVLHQHRHRQQTDTARHGRQLARNLSRLGWMHVTHECRTAFSEHLQPLLGLTAE
jgi:hypothetical protein